jgi:hypothetical protein
MPYLWLLEFGLDNNLTDREKLCKGKLTKA